ncbi:AMP-binding protein [Actinomadura sp. KC216]|uniref:AMP-binding protein n=1 Tax=Actinomadura sp. KC216 TaxID=2530370 RepID=UPI001404C51B|nr:AMP-binding protein [Actinomadura sp. KC216]
MRRRALERPERRTFTFLVDGGEREESITNAELDAQARAIACLLQERELSGERVLLLFLPGLELITALFGCLYAKTAAALAYPRQFGRNRSRLLSMAADSQPSALLTTSMMAKQSAQAFADAPLLDALPKLTTDDVDPARAASWRNPGIRPDDLALLQYTSGSTRAPRGVMVTHANLMHNLGSATGSFLGITADSRGVLWLPPYHDMGLIGGIFAWPYLGATVTLMSPMAFLQRPVRWLQAISRTKATVSGGPNFGYDLCVRKITQTESAGVDLTSWTAAWNGAETVRTETQARFAETFRSRGFRGEAFRPCYGLAEATLIVTGCSWPATSVSRPASPRAADGAGARETGSIVSCGRPLRGQRVVIADPEHRTRRAPGEVGEIWVAGPSVAAGYWGRPEESARVFGATLADGDGPFLRTGDLGFLRDGELYVAGRLKDLIIIRGRNIHPQDVEHTAERCHPALRPGSGAAFSVDVDGTENLVVVFEVNAGPATSLSEVAEAVRHAVVLGHEVHPHAVVLIEPRGIPKTSSGKIQRGATRDSFLAGTLPVLTEVRAATAPGQRPGRGPERMDRQWIQDWLVTELARRADVDPERIDLDASWHDHGLDSLQSVALVRELEELLGIALPETLAWDHPSTTALAEHLARLTADTRHTADTSGDRLPAGG